MEPIDISSDSDADYNFSDGEFQLSPEREPTNSRVKKDSVSMEPIDLSLEPVLLEGGGDGADYLLVSDANCQGGKEEETVLPEGGSCGKDHVNQELDTQNQSGLCIGHGTSDTEAQNQDEEGGGGYVNDQEAIPYVMNIDGNCQEEEVEPVLPEGGGCDTDHVNQKLDTENQSGLCIGHGTIDTEAQNQDEEEEEERFLPEGGGSFVNDQEAIPYIMNIDGNCQEEEEEPVLPQDGSCDMDHVNKELDTQNQSGLCIGHGTSDAEAQNDDATNREERMESASNGGQPDIDPTLPFMKTLSFWESIESCEAFRLLPQRPHFRPLVELDPEIREQEAIKFAVGFATLVEKIASLKPDVSVGLFHHYLKQLEDLELFGFDVKAPVDRISSLLAIQKKREHIRRRLNGVRDRIAEKAGEKVKLEEGINQMDRELQEAESRQGIRISLKQVKEAEAASLELQLPIINKKVSSAEEQFKALISAPW